MSERVCARARDIERLKLSIHILCPVCVMLGSIFRLLTRCSIKFHL